jgi:hypothetical protein
MPGVSTKGEDMAARILLVLAALGILYGCGKASSPEHQEKQGGVEEAATPTATKLERLPPKAVEGSFAEPVDVGNATILVNGAYKTENNPKMRTLRSLHYEGTFVLVFFVYTAGGKQPVEMPEPLALTLEDSEGRFYATDEEHGIASSYASRQDLRLSEFPPTTVNPGVPWATVVAFPIPPDASGFTLRGGGPACPQCGKGFEIDLGDALSTPPSTPNSSSSAPATPEEEEAPALLGDKQMAKLDDAGRKRLLACQRDMAHELWGNKQAAEEDIAHLTKLARKKGTTVQQEMWFWGYRCPEEIPGMEHMEVE